MFEVIITKPASDDIQANYEWWRDHRSEVQAEKWYDRIFDKIATLSHMPLRCPRAPEAEKIGRDIHQALFGTSNTTHRIVFEVKNQTVIVLRVRGLAQDDFRRSDLSS